MNSQAQLPQPIIIKNKDLDNFIIDNRKTLFKSESLTKHDIYIATKRKWQLEWFIHTPTKAERQKLYKKTFVFIKKKNDWGCIYYAKGKPGIPINVNSFWDMRFHLNELNQYTLLEIRTNTNPKIRETQAEIQKYIEAYYKLTYGRDHNGQRHARDYHYWYLKIAENDLEAAAEVISQEYFRFLKGGKQPKTRLIKDNLRKIHWTASKQVAQFAPMSKLKGTQIYHKMKNTTLKALGEILIICAFLSEIDPSYNNLSLDKSGDIIKIDGEWSFAALNDPERKAHLRFSSRDLENFPFVTDFEPSNWLDIINLGILKPYFNQKKSADIVKPDYESFSMESAANPYFREGVNLGLLKISLLTERFHQNFVKVCTGDLLDATRHPNELWEQQQNFQQVALENKDFINYLHSPEATHDINEFDQRTKKFVVQQKQTLLNIIPQADQEFANNFKKFKDATQHLRDSLAETKPNVITELWTGIKRGGALGFFVATLLIVSVFVFRAIDALTFGISLPFTLILGAALGAMIGSKIQKYFNKKRKSEPHFIKPKKVAIVNVKLATENVPIKNMIQELDQATQAMQQRQFVFSELPERPKFSEEIGDLDSTEYLKRRKEYQNALAHYQKQLSDLCYSLTEQQKMLNEKKIRLEYIAKHNALVKIKWQVEMQKRHLAKDLNVLLAFEATNTITLEQRQYKLTLGQAIHSLVITADEIDRCFKRNNSTALSLQQFYKVEAIDTYFAEIDNNIKYEIQCVQDEKLEQVNQSRISLLPKKEAVQANQWITKDDITIKPAFFHLHKTKVQNKVLNHIANRRKSLR